jgi:TRAP-type mannitol/chloroaromatic compound transport system substrate-binding protein
MKDRRDFLTKSAIIGAGALLSGCDNAKKEIYINKNKKTTIRLATSWPANFPIMGTGIDRFAKRLEKISQNTLRVKVYPKNVLVPALGVFDACSSGAIDAYHSASYFYKGKNEAFNLFTGFPFGMSATEMNAWMDYGGGMELWRDLYARYNLVPFKGGNTDVQMGGWFKKEINSLSDLKGLKMRIPGLGGEVFAKLGVQPTLLPAGEIYVALERNVLDATEWLGPSLDTIMGFQKVAKYYYTGWHEPGSMLSLVFNQKKFNSLSQEQKMMIEMASNELNSTMCSEFQAKNTTALKRVYDAGATIKTFPKEIIDAAKIAMDEVVKEKSKKSEDFKKVWESANGFLEANKKWTDMGIKAYLETRDS